MSDCLFCKMAAGVITPNTVFETPQILAFRDIHPQAPTHVLIIPKRHISTINDLQPEDAGLIGEMLLAAKTVAQQDSITQSGYRTVMNCNGDGGQSVFHIHLHVLGGRALGWPPG